MDRIACKLHESYLHYNRRIHADHNFHRSFHHYHRLFHYWPRDSIPRQYHPPRMQVYS